SSNSCNSSLICSHLSSCASSRNRFTLVSHMQYLVRVELSSAHNVGPTVSIIGRSKITDGLVLTKYFMHKKIDINNR
ncbi:MAG TPA: hypothetical protein VE544_11925, partial [Nitrososphaeraceae archaeon]|nr:hypothetical protein [Nitrososphaeraceae archaeon]